MLVFNGLLVAGFIKVPELDMNGRLFLISFTSTIFSFVSTILTLKIESNGIKENWLEYMLISVKAKQNWVPFGSAIEAKKDIDHNLDYNNIQYKIPWVTDIFGQYQTLQFQFNEQIL